MCSFDDQGSEQSFFHSTAAEQPFFHSTFHSTTASGQATIGIVPVASAGTVTPLASSLDDTAVLDTSSTFSGVPLHEDHAHPHYAYNGANNGASNTTPTLHDDNAIAAVATTTVTTATSASKRQGGVLSEAAVAELRAKIVVECRRECEAESLVGELKCINRSFHHSKASNTKVVDGTVATRHNRCCPFASS